MLRASKIASVAVIINSPLLRFGLLCLLVTNALLGLFVITCIFINTFLRIFLAFWCLLCFFVVLLVVLTRILNQHIPFIAILHEIA